jgi:hypothetical protein
MLTTIVKYGVIAGVIVGGATFATAVIFQGTTLSPATGMLIGYTSMLVALSFVFMGVKHQRDTAGGGVIGFWPALGLGLSISLVAGVFYVLAWEAALAVTAMDFAAEWSEQTLTEARARGDSAAEIARISAEMAQFRSDYARPVYRMLVTFSEILPIGLLVSLVSAALLRNSRFLPASAGSLPEGPR